ncbi:MAG: anti-sigma factor antagonist [Acidobacteriaceae bacterium]|nr:anti-sigma factor antagonist [Acidobacteriaceae bacterium]
MPHPANKVRSHAILLFEELVLFREKSRQAGNSDMQVRVQDRGSGCLVTVSGRITINSSPHLRSLLFECLRARGSDGLLVDLSDAVYIDTSAVAVFLEALSSRKAVACRYMALI